MKTHNLGRSFSFSSYLLSGLPERSTRAGGETVVLSLPEIVKAANRSVEQNPRSFILSR